MLKKRKMCLEVMNGGGCRLVECESVGVDSLFIDELFLRTTFFLCPTPPRR